MRKGCEQQLCLEQHPIEVVFFNLKGKNALDELFLIFRSTTWLLANSLFNDKLPEKRFSALTRTVNLSIFSRIKIVYEKDLLAADSVTWID
ncbi:MAG: hypothetical protein K0M40_05360 [Prolixibacteraceae bacterium]|nr:hypothetical protein [Prolixibacteraceae bacterium]